MMNDLTRALNKLFWKLPPPRGYEKVGADTIAAFWVAELRDAGIRVRWNSEAEQFEEEQGPRQR